MAPSLASTGRAALALVPLVLATAPATAQLPGPQDAVRRPTPPSITTDLAPDASAFAGQVIRFRVHASDPDSSYSLRLLNPPPGLVFQPLRDEASPRTVEIHWQVSRLDFYGTFPRVGRYELLFEARDGEAPELRTRLAVPIRMLGFGWHDGILHGDVTGDGILDVVAGARYASIGPNSRQGAIYVFAGGDDLLSGGTEPSARLTVPSGAAGDSLGNVYTGQGIQLADVTGDGVLDVVAGAAGANSLDGAVYVYAGGEELAGDVAPTVALIAPGTEAGIGYTDSGQGLQIADVTGDGFLDIVAGAVFASEFAEYGGAIYVFAGGPEIVHLDGPSAVLANPQGRPEDFLGFADDHNQGILIGDVTGDDVLDVVACAILANRYGKQDVGALYLFTGGSDMKGAVGPTATLAVEKDHASVGDLFGWTRWGQNAQLVDVTGDGVLDVVASSERIDLEGQPNVGLACVWAGAPDLSGYEKPSAYLSPAAPQGFDGLGNIHVGRGLSFADVTGDGTLDVIARTPGASGSDFEGLIYVFAGGSGLAGWTLPAATLRASASSEPGYLEPALELGVQLADVNGDGITDVVANDGYDLWGVGSVLVFHGGPDLSGLVTESAKLRDPNGTPDDRVGDRFHLIDATGDGVLDVLVNAPRSQAGAVFLFEGGAGMTDLVPPLAVLTVPGAAEGDGLGGITGVGILLGDVTGDGVPDLVAGAEEADVEGVEDAGAIYVFADVPSLSGQVPPTATLVAETPGAGDRMGAKRPQGFHLVDVTGDDVLDVVSGCPEADVLGVEDAGAFYVFGGGPALTGQVTPTSSLMVPGALPGDRLGNNSVTNNGLYFADVTGDGLLEVIGGCWSADTPLAQDVGAVYIWSGPTLVLEPPAATLTVPEGVEDDRFGL